MASANGQHWAFIVADNRGWTRHGPVLLVDDRGECWTAQPGVYDAFVIHPRTISVGGRPHWMAMGGLRKPVVVDVPRLEQPVLLQASLAGELERAVPVDQVIIWPGKPVSSLYLRLGTYVIRIIDRHGTELFRKTRVVRPW